VSTDADGGIDKLNLLSEIDGARPPLPGPLPPPLEGPLVPPAPALLRAGPRTPTLLDRGLLHRAELASMASGFVGLVWLAVGIAVPSWPSGLIGAEFLLAAVAAGSMDAWTGD
jgi:hypothetical protein